MQRTYKNHIEVGERLLELGLPEPLLRQAVTAGLLGWLSCTENHPPSFRGINAWAETVRGLREIFLPRAGTVAVIRAEELTTGLTAETPLKATPLTLTKFAPVIVTLLPTGPLGGVNPLMTGAVVTEIGLALSPAPLGQIGRASCRE